MNLKTYTGERIPVVGKINIPVVYKDQTKTLPLIIVEGCGSRLMGRSWLKHLKLCWSEIKNVRSRLMGRNWLKHLKLCWSEIKNVKSVSKIDTLLKKYEHILQKDELGTIKTNPHLKVDSYPLPKAEELFVTLQG